MRHRAAQRGIPGAVRHHRRQAGNEDHQAAARRLRTDHHVHRVQRRRAVHRRTWRADGARVHPDGRAVMLRSQQLARVSAEDFVRMFESMGATKLSRHLKISERAVNFRRARLEKHLKRQIVSPDTTRRATRTGIEHPHRIPLAVKDGYVLVGSDAHYWPDIITTAHRAFVKFAEMLHPKAIILNGDVLDGATISRHAPIGWEDRPKLVDEVEACKARVAEIQKAWPAAERVWTLGNHDGRFETRLATVAPEYARMYGVHLKDHFPQWRPCWSCWINDEIVVKHRYKGGIHATHNNTLWAGKTIVTGHLHSLKVTPLDDYNGTRWGVDSGTLAEPSGPQFRDYTEDNPLNWRSGFIVLRFIGGQLLRPQEVRVIDADHVDYCNEVVTV